MEPERVTRNLDALLLENQALRQEVAALREELRRLRARGRLDGVTGAGWRVTTGTAPSITSEQTREWMEDLARQNGWSRLRVEGLRRLIDALRAPEASGDLEDDLDRRVAGLGSDLRRALRSHTGKGKQVVRAAFARYGPRAPEWLSADPRRVVADLLADLEELDARQHRENQQREPQERKRHQGPSRSRPDSRAKALAILGLGAGATLQEVKAAHRRLVKRHHPDVGGEVDTFRRIDAAYRLLIG
ncbi:MAG: DnaJ domain-containing protein [Synechococcaceae cyanobacterium]|jgi:hypothetical protein